MLLLLLSRSFPTSSWGCSPSHCRLPTLLQPFGQAVESVVLRRAYGFALNGDRAPDEVPPFHLRGMETRSREATRGCRNDKDFEADDRLPFSCSWEVLPPRRLAQALQ